MATNDQDSRVCFSKAEKLGISRAFSPLALPVTFRPYSKTFANWKAISSDLFRNNREFLIVIRLIVSVC